ncbi:MAG TPA: hypothetical protein PLF44_07375 [Candidatus Mcinerneyibacteriales bacterium]|nr:hypothetical protein [Candidatus Mcinerneyibacteriales bacterium]
METRSEIMLGILKEPDGLHESYIQACESLKVPYRIIDIISDDWIERLEECPCSAFLCRPTARRMVYKQMFDERIFFLEREMKRIVYPSYREIMLYENKRVLLYWLRIHHIPHPITHIFYDKDEALAFINEGPRFPLFFKTNLGSGGGGVRVIKGKRAARRLISRIFTRTGLGFKGFVKWARGPLGIPYPLFDDIQFNNIYFQEAVQVKHEWRGVKIGESFFIHEKLPDKKGFRSGSGKAAYGHPGDAPLNFLKKVCDSGNFRSMNVDFFETEEGEFLVNELHTVFASKINPYQTKVDGVPGRFLYNNKSWVFEPGEFNRFDSCELRVKDVLNLLEEKNG